MKLNAEEIIRQERSRMGKEGVKKRFKGKTPEQIRFLKEIFIFKK